jgi:D-glycero-alpha-D-manno-heptose-7-phosphate kinase
MNFIFNKDTIIYVAGHNGLIGSAYGGFNEIKFHADDTFTVEPKIFTQSRVRDLNNHLMLFFYRNI